VSAVTVLAATGAVSVVLIHRPGARIAIGVGAAVVFAVGVWRYVLDDAERAGLRRVLT
jgi:hypothetical protein